MKRKLTLNALLVLVLFLALAPTIMASTTPWYVDGGHGSDSHNCVSFTTACETIGHAISLAHPGDTIMVAPATYSENLTISKSLTIIGSGAATTIIDGGRAASVVTIPSSTFVTLSMMTIRNGQAGVYNSGNLSITSTTISDNRIPSGAGISNGGTLTINKSTVSGNLATRSCSWIPRQPIKCWGGRGAGIYNSGTLTINNSTISGNVTEECLPWYTCVAPGGGGGIDNHGGLTISNSTISGNSAHTGGGINGSATLQNSIIANNSGTNCSSGIITSNGYNLSSDGTCNFSNHGDRNNISDPKLGTLGNYGGPTETIPLLSGSPAIDAGNPSGCTDGQGHLLKTDQRGMPRPNTEDIEDKKGCDMGAYERQSD